MPVRRRGVKSLLVGNPFHSLKTGIEKLVRLRLNPTCDAGLRRPSVRRIVLEAAIMGRIMRRGDHNAIGKSGSSSTIVRENRVGDDGRRSKFFLLCKHDFHPICRQHFQSAGKSGRRERMRVHAEEQRAIDFLLCAVQAKRLGDGEDMRFVE